MVHRPRACLIVLGVLVALCPPGRGREGGHRRRRSNRRPGRRLAEARPTARRPRRGDHPGASSRSLLRRLGPAAVGLRPELAAERLHQEQRAAVVVGNRALGLSPQGQLRHRARRSTTRTCRPPDGNWLGSSNDPATDVSYLQFQSFVHVRLRLLVPLAQLLHRLVRHPLRRGRRGLESWAATSTHEGAGQQLHGPERERPHPVHAQQQRQPDERRPAGRRAGRPSRSSTSSWASTSASPSCAAGRRASKAASTTPSTWAAASDTRSSLARASRAARVPPRSR